MIDKNILYPLFLAFAISVALSPFIIPFLQRLKVGQTERKEGVQSHLKKAGTCLLYTSWMPLCVSQKRVGAL